MPVKKNSNITEEAIKKITKNLHKKQKDFEFKRDIEFLAQQEIKPTKSQGNLSTKPPILSRLYRRFTSPRRLIGRFIDAVKNKFYYETQHFIGAIVDTQDQINQVQHAQIQDFQNQLKERDQKFTALSKELTTLTENLANSTANQKNSLEAHQAKITKVLGTFLNAVTKLNTQISSLQSDLRSLSEQESTSREQINTLEENFNNFNQKLRTATQKLSHQIQNIRYPSLKFNYLDFEKTFYGDHESLQNKHKQYLPYIKNKKTLLDIGCGSGAFLTLVKSLDLQVTGVDSDANVVRDAQKHHPEIIHADALKYLRRKDGSNFDVISSMHMIEHLHPQDWLEFLQLAYKRLNKGGLLILETPNNQMLGVFNKGFYMDPTHIRPVHPQTLDFVLKDIGFKKTQQFTSSSLPEGDRLESVSDQRMNRNIQKLNQTLFGDQDFSIIAYK